MRTFLSTLFLLATLISYSQTSRFEFMLSDSAMANASVSFCVADADSEYVLISYNPLMSLIPASTLKLVTSAAAIELLGPDHTFKTTIGYTGSINRRSGRLDGNIVIKGGGDPSLGSEYFSDHYKDFITSWTDEIKKAGIKKIRGKIITDDSYFDFEPVAPRWLWEDIGAWYGAGVYGLSVFDNSCMIVVKSAPDSSHADLISITPDLPGYTFTNRLIPSDNRENWYVYSAPYSSGGWLSGSVPAGNEEYTIDGSIPDPPLLIAKILNEKLESEGIHISGEPATIRLEPATPTDSITIITETVSPFLSLILDVLNKESINLYAEHLVKELGKQFKNRGTTLAGVSVIMDFLSASGIDITGVFLEDGSGLSARNGINSESLIRLLIYMRNSGKHFPGFYSSLPDAGKNGTLSQYFTDPIFESNLKAKSGSMTRVRCYAGYLTTLSGRHLAFSIMINNFQGKSNHIINLIEDTLKEIILYK